MRILVALVLVAVACGFVMHERKASLERRLGKVASTLAGRPAHVHCQGLVGETFDVTTEQGSVWFDAGGQPADTTDLKRPICAALARYRSDVEGPAYGCVVSGGTCPARIEEEVLAVHVLAHESRHLRGERSESLAECNALQTTAEAARLLGADPERAQATAAYVLVHIYPTMPPEYQEADCVNGEPRDLRPDDPVWP